jgi:GH24 family phage-related lysozyme (muramidase)
MKPPSKNTLKLIYEYEVGGGEKYYNKYLKRFTWPGAASGPTIGIGIDTAYYSKEELAEIFSYLPAKHRRLVENASGKKGKAGEEYTKTLSATKIEMPWNLAERIFMFTTWKKFANLAESVFPQLEDLCGDAYGAIVSLVFNRGSSLKGDSRLEMRQIKWLIPNKDYAGIAEQIRKMKRLWQGRGLDGLVRRREAEAAAVESCLQQS